MRVLHTSGIRHYSHVRSIQDVSGKNVFLRSLGSSELVTLTVKVLSKDSRVRRILMLPR